MCILDAHLHHPDPKALAKRILQTPRMSKGEENWSSELGRWEVGGWGEKHQMRISAKGKGEGKEGERKWEREVGAVGRLTVRPSVVRNMRWREIGAARARGAAQELVGGRGRRRNSISVRLIFALDVVHFSSGEREGDIRP